MVSEGNSKRYSAGLGGREGKAKGGKGEMDKFVLRRYCNWEEPKGERDYSLVRENKMIKYTTKTGQNTGTLKTENHVHTKLIAMALVAECQNLNSGKRRMNGRNSSSCLV